MKLADAPALCILAALLSSSAACESKHPYPGSTGSDTGGRTCPDPITKRTTLAKFIADRKQWPGAYVERGCGRTALFFPAFGRTRLGGPPTSFVSFEGSASFFDGSGELVGEFVGSDVSSEISCKGMIWMGCEGVTICALNWSYPKAGELCAHSSDAGDGDADGG